MRIRGRRVGRWWMAGLILFLLLRLPSFFEPHWYGDENVYLTVGFGIRQGLKLYSQIFDHKPPTIYFLASIFNQLAGLKILAFLATGASVILVGRISKIFLKHPLAEAATLLFLIFINIPLLEGNIFNAEILVLPLVLLAYYKVLGGKKNWWLAGLLGGIAITIKFQAIFDLGFLVVVGGLEWAEGRKKVMANNLFLMFLGLATPAIVWAGYFWPTGDLHWLVGASIAGNIGYVAAGGGVSGLLYRTAGLTAGLTLVLIGYFKKIIDKRRALALMWFGLTAFGAFFSGRPYPHYLLLCLPSFFIIMLGWFQNKDRSNLAKFLEITILMAVLINVLVIGFRGYKVVVYYANFYKRVLNIEPESKYLDYFDAEVRRTYEISKYVAENTKPEDKIWVLGDQPAIYYLAKRKPTGRYVMAYHLDQFGDQAEFLDTFKANLPRLAVIYPGQIEKVPAILTIIERYYQIKKAFGEVLVYQKR